MSGTQRRLVVFLGLLVLVVGVLAVIHHSHVGTHTDRPLTDVPQYQKYRQTCEAHATSLYATDSDPWTDAVVNCLGNYDGPTR